MLEFESIVMSEFGVLAEQFGLKFLRVDDNEVLLSGNGFAIDIVRDFADVVIRYIKSEDGGGFSYFPLTGTLIEKRFTKMDRSLYGSPVSIEARIRASLRVYASGLMNECRDILTGDLDWLKKNQGKDRSQWSGAPVSYAVRHALIHNA